MPEATKDERSAFSSLYSDCVVDIRKSLRKLVKTDAEAEDIAQDVFVKAFKQYNPLWTTQPFRFKAWAKVVLRRELYKLSRRNGNGHTFSLERLQEMGEEENFFSALLESPLNGVLEKKEMQEMIRYVVDSLPEKYRAVIKLRYFQNQSIENISILLGQKPKTVKQQLFRGLGKLRARLALEADC